MSGERPEDHLQHCKVVHKVECEKQLFAVRSAVPHISRRVKVFNQLNLPLRISRLRFPWYFLFAKLFYFDGPLVLYVNCNHINFYCGPKPLVLDCKRPSLGLFQGGTLVQVGGGLSATLPEFPLNWSARRVNRCRVSVKSFHSSQPFSTGRKLKKNR